MADSTYFVSALASVAGASKRHLTIWNGHATIRLRILLVRAAGAPIAAVTGLVIPLYCTRITTVPIGGVLLTPIKADPDTDINVPAGIEFRTGATTGAVEELSAFGVGIVSGEETAAPYTSVLYQMTVNGAKPVVILPSTGMVVKQGALASAGAINVVVCLSLR